MTYNLIGFRSDNKFWKLSKKKIDRIVSISMWDTGRNPFFFIELEKVPANYEILLLGNWRTQEYYDLFVKSLPENSQIKLKTNISEKDYRKRERIVSFSTR